MLSQMQHQSPEPRVDPAEETLKFPGLKITVVYLLPSEEHKRKQDPRAQQGFPELSYLAGGIAGVSQYGFHFITAQTRSHYTRCPPYGEIRDGTNDECKHTACS